MRRESLHQLVESMTATPLEVQLEWEQLAEALPVSPLLAASVVSTERLLERLAEEVIEPA